MFFNRLQPQKYAFFSSPPKNLPFFFARPRNVKRYPIRIKLYSNRIKLYGIRIKRCHHNVKHHQFSFFFFLLT